MRCRIAGALLFAASALLAQMPNPCIGQQVPLEPAAMMSNPQAKPVCITDANGINGHWAWAVPADKSMSGGVQAPPSLEQSYLSVTNNTAYQNAAQQAAQSQQQQLQIQIQQEQLRQLHLQSQQAVAAPAIQAKPRPSADFTDPALRNSLGNWNGRFWGLLSDEQKPIYLLGLGDAASNIVSIDGLTTRADYHASLSKYWPESLTFAEITTALNGFYETPENRPIPIVDALGIISQRLSGTPEDQIQKHVETLRSIAVLTPASGGTK